MTQFLSKISEIIAILAVLLFTASCNDDFVVPGNQLPDSPGTITLHLKNSVNARSTDGNNADIAIKNLYIGFYKLSGESGGIGIGGSSVQDETLPADKWIVLEDLNESDSYTLTVQLTKQTVEDLFGDSPQTGDACKVFVLANIFSPNTVPDKASIREMRQLAIQSDFFNQDQQTSFVMAADGEAYYQAPASGEKIGKVSGEAMLIRAAAKINLNVKFSESVVVNADGEEETWRPVTDNNGIMVLINNGVQKAIAEPKSDNGTPWKPGMTPESDPDTGEMLSDMISDGEDDDNPYYNSSLKVSKSFRYLSNTNVDEDDPHKEYNYRMNVPFYTYPNAWEETLDEKHKTSLTLIIPWHRDGDPAGSNYIFYYQVPVTPDIYFISRNTSYNIYLTVAMLGSIVPDDPVEIPELSYQIIDWGEENISTIISDYRYLVVDPNVYTISNESLISIPFFTSHDTEIYEITMTYPQFNYPKSGDGEVVDITVDKDVIDETNKAYQNQTEVFCKYRIYKDPDTNQMYIEINHPMIMWQPVTQSGGDISFTEQGKEDDGTGSYDKVEFDDKVKSIFKYRYPSDPEMAFYPYIFNIKVRHSDNYTFNGELKITQYPGMYIVADKNPGGEYLSYERTDENVVVDLDAPEMYNYGFTFVNPEPISTLSGTAWLNSDVYKYITYITDKDANKETVISEYKKFYSQGLGGLRPYGGSNTSGDVSNPNMYVINITQLASYGTQHNYNIGDPRSKNINNLLTNESMAGGSSAPASADWCQSAATLYGTSPRTLSFYYPTDESDAYKMMIAPKLRISSAFGYVRQKNTIVDCADGRRRAATYQEQGYPAGRWRLPTYGEVEFIVKLSAAKKIPALFSTGDSYLTAQGAFTILETGDTVVLVPTEDTEDNSSYARNLFDRGVFFDVWYPNSRNRWEIRSNSGVNVRPVYDEWYWELQDYKLNKNASGAYIYTLGDVPVIFN